LSLVQLALAVCSQFFEALLVGSGTHGGGDAFRACDLLEYELLGSQSWRHLETMLCLMHQCDPIRKSSSLEGYPAKPHNRVRSCQTSIAGARPHCWLWAGGATDPALKAEPK
jgi:hypothetical protein